MAEDPTDGSTSVPARNDGAIPDRASVASGHPSHSKFQEQVRV